jgi:hypothetical protein
MIGQEIGLGYLIPIALEHLVKNPFIEGDYYMGDLLANVLSIDEGFWAKNPELQLELDTIMIEVKSTFETLGPLITDYNELK